jgi:glycogen debranching enzyme
MIDPYSNWRGPIWINANAVLAYSLRSQGYEREAAQLADAIVALLASDLVVNNGQWHECYDSDNGTALAAPGFLSWNTLGATLQADVAAGLDPFSLNG